MDLHNYPVRAQVPVSDIATAADFYERKLGLPVVRSTPSAAIDSGARVYGAGNGTSLIVYQSTAAASEGTVATWFVGDIHQVVATLDARGVVLERYPSLHHDPDGITDRAGGGYIAWFRDPDGNTFAIESDA